MSHRSILIVLSGSSSLALVLAAACGGRSGKTSPGFTTPTRDAAIDQIAASDGAGGMTPAPGEPAGDGGEANSPNAPVPTDASTGFVRLANWAPDAPTAGFDICIMPHGGNGGWTGPLTGAGVAFPTVGRYAAVAPGLYDLGVVAPGSGCGAPVTGVVGLPMLPANARTTVALVGDLKPSGNDQPLKVVTLIDDVTGPAGLASVRFIDAMPGASSVIFGTGTEASLSFSALTGQVPFGGVSSSPVDGGLADGNGYVLLRPATNTTLSAHVPDGEVDISNSTSTSFGNGGLGSGLGSPGIFDSASDLATGSNASWSAGSSVTVALVKSGSIAQLVLCQDDAATMGSLSACSVLSR